MTQQGNSGAEMRMLHMSYKMLFFQWSKAEMVWDSDEDSRSWTFRQGHHSHSITGVGSDVRLRGALPRHLAGVKESLDLRRNLERATGFEPATLSLGS